MDGKVRYLIQRSCYNDIDLLRGILKIKCLQNVELVSLSISDREICLFLLIPEYVDK